LALECIIIIIIFANEITVIKLHFEGEDQQDMIQASRWEQ
jgi:hypothetical protein